MASTDLRKTLTDAGYIAIGLGVMTLQQAQIRGRELRNHASNAVSCVNDRTRDARDKVGEQSRTAKTQVRVTVIKAQELGGELGKKVEPMVGQVQAQLGELPERVVQAMEPVAARVREMGGSAA